ncbi:hypothetical protein THRCLA_01266 [Thraustotheca clavata]|uniref:Globin domain-containing protein n=1 Tax=Thraustotheca clavata TaxID=74557 RepID=A0A1W0A8U5_9STRA|nr:hypothetical protein THRCLA_01266 [Thraustotheca clavata]
MGSGGSVDEGSMLYVDEHGSIGLKSDYTESLLPEMDFDIKQPVVTKQHEAIIHKHWAIVCRGTAVFHKEKHLTPTKFFATTFYSNLFKAAPEVRPMFRSSMTVQGKALTGLVALLATVIKANNIVSACHDLARMHARYGTTKAHYTSIGKTLIQTLEEVSGPEWSEEIRTAYLTSYCLLYYIMLPVILETPRRPLQLCLPGHVARKQALSNSSFRLTIAVDFPLRYHPGDSILLGLAMKDGEVRRSYAITSLYEAGMHTFDICVYANSETSKWLCGVPTDTVINIYWINAGVHLETDTHTSIPRKLLFISENMSAAPLFAMTKGLYTIRDQHDGDRNNFFYRKLNLQNNIPQIVYDIFIFYSNRKMGGGVSHEESSMIYSDSDGNLCIKDAFLAALTDAMDLEIKRPIVKREHEPLIKKHWAAVVKGTSAFDPAKHLTPTKFFYTTFYSMMFEESPTIRPMFRSAMTVQGKVLAGIIGTMATVIKSKNVVQFCQDMAARHTTFGATKDHYNVMGTVLLKTLAIVSGPEWNDAVAEAYLTSYCFLYYIMLPVKLLQKKCCHQLLCVFPSQWISHYVIILVIQFYLAFPMPGGEVRRSYAITSVYDVNVKSFDICVENVSASSKWLSDLEVDGIVNVYWINGGVHFETDTPESIPKKLLFISEGIGAAPLYAMTKGVYAIRDAWDGNIVAIQCTAEPVPLFQTINWDKSKIITDRYLSKERIAAMAPDISQRRLYIAGSAAFATEAKNLFIQAGGNSNEIEVYNFDNTPYIEVANKIYLDFVMSWLLGVLLSAVSSIVGVLGKVMLKLSFNHQSTSRWWWAGGMFCIVVLNPVLCLAAYNFAPQSLLAPMGGLCIVWNSIFSPWILEEPLRARDIFGAALIFLGCIVVSVNGGHEIHRIPVDDLPSHFLSVQFIVYFCIFAITSIGLRYLSSAAFNQNHSPDLKFPYKKVSCRVALSILAGSLSGQLYCMTSLLRLLQNGVTVLFTSPLAYFVGAGAIFFALAGLHVLNMALKLYDALFVIYLYESTLIATGAISGICFFDDMYNVSLLRWILYWVGISGMFLGIGVISHGEALKLRSRGEPIVAEGGEASRTLLV